ncbi:MAG: type III-A CRISPR-associated protein Csm2, partial [Deltaproteobacteria bacterium]|nr:type III-A CRISPR-associated protein Csm2 [Deltaproteobacteria bacterium]
MSSYYYTDAEKSVIKEKLLTDEALSWAQKCIRPRGDDKLNSSQLRKFYTEIKALEMLLRTETFDVVKPQIKMLKSKVAYSCPKGGRKKDKKIPEEFKSFMYEHIEQINDKQDFKAFCLCFEAMVGFFYGE